MNNNHMISLINSFSAGRSGGDVAFAEVVKRFELGRHDIVTSKLGMRFCEEIGVKGTFHLTTTEESFDSVLRIYFWRILLGIYKGLTLPVPDVVYVSTDILPDVIPAILLRMRARLSGRRLFCLQKFFHINHPDRKLSSWTQRLSLWMMRHYADKVSTCSHQSKRWLTERGFSDEFVAVNYLGINLEDIEPVSPVEERYTGVFLGRMHRSKGVFDFVPIWREVVERFPDARLAVIGTGDAETETALRAAIREANLEANIILLGYMAGRDAFAVMKAGDLFVFPSHEEGFGIVLAEAMACGLCVVGYDLPVYRETFAPAMERVPCFDAKQFGQRVVQCLSDDAMKERLKRRAQDLVRGFTWEECSRREAALIEWLAPGVENRTSRALPRGSL